MFRVIAEPSEIAPARKIEKLEPWLERHGEQKAPAAERAEPLKVAARLDEMLHHLARNDQVEQAPVSRPGENIGFRKGKIGPTRLGVADGFGAKIDADIAGKIDIPLCELIDEERLAAAEIENGSRRGLGAGAGCDRRIFGDGVCSCRGGWLLLRRRPWCDFPHSGAGVLEAPDFRFEILKRFEIPCAAHQPLRTRAASLALDEFREEADSEELKRRDCEQDAEK